MLLGGKGRDTDQYGEDKSEDLVSLWNVITSPYSDEAKPAGQTVDGREQIDG